MSHADSTRIVATAASRISSAVRSIAPARAPVRAAADASSAPAPALVPALALAFAFCALLGGAGCENTVQPVARSGDRTPPAVREVDPVAGSVDVATSTSIEVVFSEPVDPTTVDLASFAVASGASAVSGVVRASAGGTRFVFTPASGLLPSRAMVQITLGETIRDLAGNDLAAPYTWSFTTRADDPVPGTPTAPSPADSATGIGIDPVLAWQVIGGAATRFDVWLGESLGNLQPIAGDLEASRLQAGPLTYGSWYAWQVVSDPDGAALAGPVWWFRTTEDPTPGNQPPGVLADLVPASGELLVDPDTDLAWSGGVDPDADPVTFEVYLGTTVDPLEVAEVTERVFDTHGLLQQGTRYWWRIVADDGRGGRTGSALQWFQTGAVNLPPTMPSSPSPADEATDVAVDTALDWAAASDPEEEGVTYDVYLGTGSSPPLVSADQDTVGYRTAGPFAFETDYVWRVVARDARGLETAGPEWSFRTTRENNPPTAPCDPQPANDATGVALNTILSWGCGVDTDPGDTVVFDVYFQAGASDPAFVGTVDEMAYTPPALLERGTPYFWRIVARDDRGLATPGPLWFFVTDENRPPTAPTNPTPADGALVSAQTLFFSWDCSTDLDGNGESYEFYLALGQPSFGEPRVVVPFSQCSAGPFGIGVGQWFWQVVAVDEAGARTASEIWSFRSGVSNDPPGAPTDPDPASGASVQPGQQMLRWGCATDPDGDDVRYEVFAAYGEQPTLDDPSATTDFGVCEAGPFDVTAAPLPYYWRVVSIDELGARTVGPLWSYTSVFDNTPPSAPCNPSPGTNATGVPLEQVLAWSCGEDPDGHAVEYDVYLDAVWPPTTLRETTSVRSWAPGASAALEVATTYFWKVVARDELGAETAGPVWQFETIVNRPPTIPTNPTPADGTTIDPRPMFFRWICSTDPDGDDVHYEVYVALDEPTFGEPWAMADLCRAGPHGGGVGTYFWKVVAIDERGAVAEGPVWTFVKAE